MALTGLTLASMALHAATFELVSAAWDDARPAGGRQIAISPDGRYVVFESESAQIVSGDTNGVMDVFLRDRLSGRTTRVSVSSLEVQGNGPSGDSVGSVTPDGRHVSFSSAASNLVPGDTNGVRDVFVRDVVAGSTERVSITSSRAQANGPSFRSILSDDGRHVLFDSEASNFVAGQTWAPTVYIRDRLNFTTGVAALDDPTARCNVGGFSGTARFAAFTCGPWRDIYIRNLSDGSVERVSRFPQPAGSVTSVSALSADGRYLVFTTTAAVLPQDTNGTYDGYLYDRKARVFELVSVARSGTSGNNSSDAASVSNDGRFVGFFSWASNLVDGDTLGTPDGFVRDRLSRTTTRLTVPPFGGCCAERGPLVSGDGSAALFTSDGLFVANDTNNGNDVFVARGFAVPTAAFTVQPRTLVFGSVPVGSTSPPQTVTVTNTGAASLAIDWVGLAGADAGEFSRVRSCPGVLPAAQQCTATVTFAPQTVGDQQARLVVSAGGVRKSASLSGVAE